MSRKNPLNRNKQHSSIQTYFKMFKYKTEEELSKMTPEQRDIYAEQKRQFEKEERQKEIKEALKVALPDRTQKMKDKNPDKSDAEIKALVDAEIKAEQDALQATEKQLKEIKEELAQLKENTTPGAAKVVKIVDEVKAKKEDLKKLLKSNGSEVVLKATTNRASISDNPHRVILPGIGQLLRVARALYDVFRKITITEGNHNGKITYLDWDEATSVKAADMVTEGAAFPESTAKFKTYDVSLKKVGDTLPVTEEFFEDEVMAAAELERFVESNVESKIDDQVANGDGTGDNLTGLLASVPAYTAVASGIQDANIYDLITKIKGAITSAGGAKYKPDFVAMNNDTMNRLLLKKDSNDQYLFPAGHPIYREIVEDNSIPSNQLVVGDSRYGTIYEMGGVTISRGMINAQFTSDQLTLKARKRLLFLIRNADKSGFRKVTDVSAALTTLATP
jgi:HK97 family phage major capsid protein